MSADKERLRMKFSSNADKYYKVALFDDLGYSRKECVNCHRHFWSIDPNRIVCPEQPCQNYEFLGDPPTSKRFDYSSAWKTVDDFFVRNGHQSIHRYPVVCRWRPDLFFTVASIVDFQRIESGKVVFEFPANPLIVPQMCLRFLDIANVGVTGRHYTSFCMIGQHALANKDGYWKDRCVELDFKLLTEEFGIPAEEIVFKEDVWLGPGAFGNSLEYYVRGLELGNAVFTGYEGTPDNYRDYSEKVIDMGAGLERFVWVSRGTPNSYDAVFPGVISKFQKSTGLGFEDTEFQKRYFELAGSLDIDSFRGSIDDYASLAKKLGVEVDFFSKQIRLMQAVYSVIDHARTLVFAISDGALPSNVGGGYNLRVVLRRSLDFLSQLGAHTNLNEIARWHVEELQRIFPDLREHTGEIETIIDVEEKKYSNTKSRTSKLVESLVKKRRSISTDELIKLYDSEGVTVEALAKAGLEISVPTDFYSRVTEKHMAERQPAPTEMEDLNLESLPPTTLIFYKNRDQFDFEANVLEILSNRYVILNSTAFYARSGGQEPDRGSINGLEVTDVTKVRDVVLHEVKGIDSGKIVKGGRVACKVDSSRRNLIMRHHTATHVVNGACRKVLGPWIWQHSAFKDEDMGRLDITHFAHLTRDQVIEIERISNQVVIRNLPVRISWMPRAKAEMEYGFRLYQGGVVPVKELRIVNIEGWDVEACGGIHCSSTGDIGLIKITKSERVQDGVERIEFVAGEAAVRYVEKQESILLEAASKLETPPEKLSASISNMKSNEDTARRTAKQISKRLVESMLATIPNLSKELPLGLRAYVSLPLEEGLDSEFHLAMGERLTKSKLSMIYIALFNEQQRGRIMVFVGKEAQEKGVKASNVTKEIAKIIGGSGGGDAYFGQGGCQTSLQRLPDIYELLKNMIESLLKS